MQCQRCFWLDVRLKISRPNSPPFNINKAIDELFKKEFDSYRDLGKPHPLMVKFNIEAIPFKHQMLNDWRQNFIGVAAIHQSTNLHIFGAIDDIWVNSKGQVMVVDYKATAKEQDVSIDSDWQVSYKRQLEIYQWLLRANNLDVSDVGYFVYANGRFDVDGFNDKLEFNTKVIPYKGDDSWINQTLLDMKKCMDSDKIPPVGDDIMGGSCSYCSYAKARTQLTIQALNERQVKK